MYCYDLRKFAREMSLEEMLTSDNDFVCFLGEQLLQADHIISFFNKYQKWVFHERVTAIYSQRCCR